jgi:hypothetical protein
MCIYQNHYGVMKEKLFHGMDSALETPFVCEKRLRPPMTSNTQDGQHFSAQSRAHILCTISLLCNAIYALKCREVFRVLRVLEVQAESKRI